MLELACLSLYLLVPLAILTVIVYIWLSRQKSEEKLKEGMEKSKDNL